eukprot:CAMPEP_0183294082 /NCGR_PEP_ID=MMETSP0160_2-20130417/2542_1 /TAXON_ID=2839 ORGANISM="Odontella Sinensis, Strain Grunow 1884" /NCGR_SAMPLE_ID=MMETSP0160_2 /ASSEMBLY_ACC=CAM_ASM_000250 /LENGTH=61 /DNA_ID=CAMNT_0025455317 /DNA_START=179 /DNA_END=361 /DNA_ORIENTATION=+
MTFKVLDRNPHKKRPPLSSSRSPFQGHRYRPGPLRQRRPLERHLRHGRGVVDEPGVPVQED